VKQGDDLQRLIPADLWFLSVLRAARKLGLQAWAIGVAAITHLVWDHLHGDRMRTPPKDVDLVSVDPRDHRPDREQDSEAQLSLSLPDVPWQITNQAAVHFWNKRVFGQAVRPLSSLDDAGATWAETATAVALRHVPNESITVISLARRGNRTAPDAVIPIEMLLCPDVP
jgi:hypothetical protein